MSHERLEGVLCAINRPVIAVSGGVNSVTLAAFAVRVVPDVQLMHAASPAVPAEATARVRALAAQYGWELIVIEAGEFDDVNYRANPVNRCFYCKTSLYGTIRARTSRQILSGANLDDLGEYRPGLDAARDHAVRHPYIEAAIDKRTVRVLARQLGLADVAELPSSPCLSSRIETGIRIEAVTLAFIHRVEQLVGATVAAATVRCRVRAAAVVVELDPDALAALSETDRRSLAERIGADSGKPDALPVRFQPYRNGSAFLRQTA